jgi:hypothetical protein
VSALTVHENCLRDIVCVVSRHHVPHAQPRGPAIQRLPSEHAAVCAVALLAHLLYDLVHSPAIQLSISQYRQVHLVLLRISLDRLQAIISVTLDALVDGQQYEVETIIISLVQCLEHASQYSAVLAARCAYCDSLATREKRICGNGVVDFGDEAVFAELRMVLRSQNQCAIRMAECAGRGRHICIDARRKCASVAGRF